jgi:hypothetical protein
MKDSMNHQQQVNQHKQEYFPSKVARHTGYEEVLEIQEQT